MASRFNENQSVSDMGFMSHAGFVLLKFKMYTYNARRDHSPHYVALYLSSQESLAMRQSTQNCFSLSPGEL